MSTAPAFIHKLHSLPPLAVEDQARGLILRGTGPIVGLVKAVPGKEKASPAEAKEADRTRTFRQTADAPKGPRLVGVWPRRSITLAALWAAQRLSLDDAPGCPAPRRC